MIQYRKEKKKKSIKLIYYTMEIFTEKDIINKDYYNNIKNVIICTKCSKIITNPVQCDQCQHCFCL